MNRLWRVACPKSSTQMRSESWRPGRLHPNLSWTHYRTLLRVDKAETRLLPDRSHPEPLVRSRTRTADQQPVVRASGAEQGQEGGDAAGHERPRNPTTDRHLQGSGGHGVPWLPESHRLVETDLEQKLLDNLQAFLLELGKGFAFVPGNNGSRSKATTSTSTWCSITRF